MWINNIYFHNCPGKFTRFLCRTCGIGITRLWRYYLLQYSHSHPAKKTRSNTRRILSSSLPMTLVMANWADRESISQYQEIIEKVKFKMNNSHHPPVDWQQKWILSQAE